MPAPRVAIGEQLVQLTMRSQGPSVIYSIYGHTAKCTSRLDIGFVYVAEKRSVAEAVKSGVESAGGSVKIHQLVPLVSCLCIESDKIFIRIPETLSTEILAKMHAPPKPDYPVISVDELKNFDAFIFGIPTRYGGFPGQWKAFWDATGGLWSSGALAGKYAGVFVSIGTAGGGEESTVCDALSTLTHHGIIFVPLGYSKAFAQLTNLTEVHGGTYLTPSSV
jgi:NAD(P)H dehydrogenase (quinone)